MKRIPLPLPQWRTLEIDLFRIYDGEVRDGGRRRLSLRSASYTTAWLLRQGTGEYHISDSEPQILYPGFWTFPSRDKTWQNFSKDAQLLSVHFRASWPDGSFLFEVGTGLEIEASRFPELEAEAMNLQDIVRAQQPDSDWFPSHMSIPLETYLKLEEALHRWIYALTGAFAAYDCHPTNTASIDDRVEQALRWLNNLPLNRKFVERQLADHLGLSVGHLNRLFAKEVGRSPVDIVENRRLDRAVHLLQYTQLPAKQLAYDLGFCSPSHFTAWFRSKTEKTPREFRRLPDEA